MRSVLCIDIGGTRIRAAVLPRLISADIAGKQTVTAMRTLGWLNPTLPDDLFVLLALRKGEIKTISIGGGNSEYVSRSLLQSQTGCEVQALWSRTLRIDPDRVPLVGLHKIVFGRDVHVEM